MKSEAYCRGVKQALHCILDRVAEGGSLSDALFEDHDRDMYPELRDRRMVDEEYEGYTDTFDALQRKVDPQ